MTAHTKTVIVIAGPTAVGKSGIGIEVAKHLNTEIISADSRQCYREMKIGVARPSDEQLSQVKHHFIASHSIYDKVNAAVFENYALEKAADIFKFSDYVVMVGGTGLYIKAFLEGMDPIPDVPEDFRNDITEQYFQYGLSWLQDEVKKSDPLFYKTGEIQNPQRLMRALEVVKATGQSIMDFRKGEKAKRNFEVQKIALELPKELLHRNINTRVDQMVEEGLVEEVQSLYKFRHFTALQTVGYKEIFDYLDDKISLAEAIEQIKVNTRQYAKRQLTWFKKDKEYQWLPPDENAVINSLNKERL